MTPSPSLPDGVFLERGPGGQQQVRIVTDRCAGQLHLHGAHVTGWVPAGAVPVLWLSPAAVYADDAAIRGGIPLCGPWFGPGISGDRKPSHGWLRTAEWNLESVRLDDGDVVVALTLDGREVEGGGPLVARYVARFGRTLFTELTLTAVEPQTVEAALHTYLAVEDVRDVVVTGLEGAEFVERAGGQSVPGRDDDPVRFVGEVDRIYASAATVTVVDPQLRRELTVGKHGSQSTVVWNPGPQKAAALADVPAGGWTDFVCVETANVQGAAHRLGANESMTLAAELAVRDA